MCTQGKEAAILKITRATAGTEFEKCSSELVGVTQGSKGGDFPRGGCVDLSRNMKI